MAKASRIIPRKLMHVGLGCSSETKASKTKHRFILLAGFKFLSFKEFKRNESHKLA